MILKKLGAALAAFGLAGALLTGCSAGLKDGVYRAEYRNYDDHGWKDYLSVTVEDGRIAAVDYDAMNEAGMLKSGDEAYREAMEPVSGTYPEQYMRALEEQLVEKQEPKKVNTVAGATTSSDSFKVLAAELISKGIKKGDTATVVVD